MSIGEQALDPQRRRVLKGALATGVVAVGWGTFDFSEMAWADTPAWPTDAFQQKSEVDATGKLYGGKTATPSDKVTLDVPEIAENGAVVPVSVNTSLPKVTSIAVLIPENPFTLTSYYLIPDGTAPSISSRLKMAKTSKVTALVESDGKLYSASKNVKVTVGGCGG